jgi:hypothetical protein
LRILIRRLIRKACIILLTLSKYIRNSILQEIIFIRGSILGFFDFGTSILGQGISVLIMARDLEGVRLSLRVLANDIKAILVRLSLIRGSSGRVKGVRGARGARGARGVKGRRFRGIFSFNISYLRRESQWHGSAGQNDNFLLFCSIFWWGRYKKG